jgi:hypothetical protein
VYIYILTYIYIYIYIIKEQEDLLGSSSSLKNENIRGGNSSVKGSHDHDNSNYSNGKPKLFEYEECKEGVEKESFR